METIAVHSGDRKKPGAAIPVTTPIFTAASYIYDETATLDRVFGKEIAGDSYARYENPTNRALEEQLTALEGGAGAMACASGMMAIQFALQAALTDRGKRVLAANALYGATINLLHNILEPLGVEIRLVDICDLAAVEKAVVEFRPGCVLMETVSNPLLRVGAIDKVAAVAREAGAALVVDNTFATPMLVRPLELGAHMVVHSLTKYLSGHGDVLGGAIIGDAGHMEIVRTMGRTAGPLLGPFEAYLSMRGIKTFPLRFRQQCENALHVASWLVAQPRVERINFPAEQDHPDRPVIQRLFPEDRYGAMISFELKDAGRREVFEFMDRLNLVVRATSLGDVHSMILYPAISSHRDLAPKQRERLGIRDNLLRLSVGIEAAEDIIEDLEQAMQ
ncbi:MAG: PLP-dependent aspartate aminotransferase family protein [Bryobacteraceae bacterium]|nr:PLP-dependent aspartate aminotransferase family protein [Bryobacteraceae bacterium]